MKNKVDKSLLLPRFKEEAYTNINTLNQGLILLEKDIKNSKIIEMLMRTAHTLKGSATIIGFNRIASLAHKFEDAISEIKKNTLKIKEKHFDILFQLLDLISFIIENKNADYSSISELEKEISSIFNIEMEKPLFENDHKDIDLDDFILKEGETIRVDVEKLDNLVNLTGELIINKLTLGQKAQEFSDLFSELEEFNRTLFDLEENIDSTILQKGEQLKNNMEQLEKEFNQINRRIDITSSDLQEGVMMTRMLPLYSLFNIFPRSVRDFSRKEGKIINVEIIGGETELGRSVLQEMEDPILHLIRNAIAHGIEKTEERIRCGKAEEGKLVLSACQQGGMVVIEVKDDGRGIDPEEIRDKAVLRKILTEVEARQMSQDQILQFIFSPGFTTKDKADQAAGRGVGLDVVRANVKKLKGQLDVKSVPGKGATFTVKLPLTLAITSALMVKSSGQIFAIPLEYLEETIRVSDDEVGRIENKEVIQVRDKIIPIVSLSELLKLKRKGLIEKKYHQVVIIKSIEKTLALMVDEFLGKYEIVVKTLGDHLAPVNNIVGSTILGTGEVSLILDIPAIIETAANVNGEEIKQPNVKQEKSGGFILIVEDSTTTSWHEKLILESAGYRVKIAENGEKALEEIEKEKPDLVITDIAMPVMDGFRLIEKIKVNNSYKNIPVIVVSSKEDESYRRKGLEKGADAYMAKSSFDSTGLLNTIVRFLG